MHSATLQILASSSSSSSTWIEVLPSVLAALLGLIGVVAGAQLSSRNLRYQWLRGERLKIHSEFISAARRMVIVYAGELRVAVSENGIGDVAAASNKLISLWSTADQKTASIALIGQDETYQAARLVMKELSNLLDGHDSQLADKTWHETETAATHAIDRFTKVAAKEIA
jgi:hypothetical protein